MDEFDAYWKSTGRIEPRDSTVKEQMRIAFRAGRRFGAAEAGARFCGELLALIEESLASPPHRYCGTVDDICPEEG